MMAGRRLAGDRLDAVDTVTTCLYLTCYALLQRM